MHARILRVRVKERERVHVGARVREYVSLFWCSRGQFQYKPLKPINIDSDFLHPDGGGAFNNRAINNMSDDYKRGFLLPFKFERKRKTK